MSSDNYLYVGQDLKIYDRSASHGPTPGERPVYEAENLADAVRFCGEYQRDNIVEYGISFHPAIGRSNA